MRKSTMKAASACGVLLLLASGCGVNLPRSEGKESASASPTESTEPRAWPEYEPVFDLVKTKLVRKNGSVEQVYLDDSLLLVQGVPDPKVTYLNNVVGIDPATGEERWRSGDLDLRKSPGLADCLYYGQNRMYVGSGAAFVPIMCSDDTGRTLHGVVALDASSGAPRWSASVPHWTPKGTGPGGRTASNRFDIVGTVGDTMVYSVHQAWSDSDLSTLNEPGSYKAPILHHAETVGIDTATGKIRWRKDGFIGTHVSRDHVIGTRPTKKETRAGTIDVIDGATGDDSWKTSWKSNVGTLSKDWMIIEMGQGGDLGPHDGVYEIATGKRVSELEDPGISGTHDSWEQDYSVAKSAGVTWLLAEKGKFEPWTLFVAKDGVREPIRYDMATNTMLDIDYPLVLEDDYTLVQPLIGEHDDQNFVDYLNGPMDRPITPAVGKSKLLTFSQGYIVAGQIGSMVLYKRR
jgi:hypothetical protein